MEIEVVYVSYYFRDYRKENSAKIIGIYRKREDAIEATLNEIFKDDLILEDGIEYFDDQIRKPSEIYAAVFNDAEDNYIIEERRIQ